MTDTPSTFKNPTHSPSRPATEPLSALRKVFPDGETILTKAQPGTKKGVKGYLEPHNLLTPEEAQERVRDGFNYGFRLGYETSNGWMLAVLDVEEQGVLPDAVAAWCNNRELVRWRSPHDGLNRLLRVTPEAYDRLSDASPIDLDGDGKHEVELLAPKRGHALAPDSTVEHLHCSEEKACDGTGTGSYRLVGVNPHAPEVEVAEVEDLLEMLGLNLDPQSAEGPDTSIASVAPSKTDDDAEWSSLDESTRRRIERAKDFHKWGDQFTALIEGRYADAGFPDDRSEAEYRLVEILGWLFDDDKTKVRRVMTTICRLNPQTSAGTRKWLKRDGLDDNYRDDTLAEACQHESTYNPPTARSPKNRPEVSAITESKVYEAVFDLRLASTQEIVNHESVDRGTTQVNEALKEYCNDGHIQWIRDGRKTLYYIGAPFVPADKRDEYDL